MTDESEKRAAEKLSSSLESPKETIFEKAKNFFTTEIPVERPVIPTGGPALLDDIQRIKYSGSRNYRVFDIFQDVFRWEEEFNFPGRFLYVYDNFGQFAISFNEPGNDHIPLKAGMSFKLPFYRFFISNNPINNMKYVRFIISDEVELFDIKKDGVLTDRIDDRLSLDDGMIIRDGAIQTTGRGTAEGNAIQIFLCPPNYKCLLDHFSVQVSHNGVNPGEAAFFSYYFGDQVYLFYANPLAQVSTFAVCGNPRYFVSPGWSFRVSSSVLGLRISASFQGRLFLESYYL